MSQELIVILAPGSYIWQMSYMAKHNHCSDVESYET